MHRLSTVAALGALGIAVLVAGPLPADDKPGNKTPDALKWNLERLSKEPFKLVKATPDPEKGLVRFVVEFAQTPEPSELLSWEQSGGPVLFRFLDEDGIVIRTVKPRLEGEFIPKKG